MKQHGTTVASVHMDALRGLAALAVFVGHWRNIFFTDLQTMAHPSILTKLAYGLTGLGHHAVIVFFVLSGYLVGSSAVRMCTRGWSWKEYLLQRMTRLWIVLIPALLLGAVWDVAGTHLFSSAAIYAGKGGQATIMVPVAQRLSTNTLVGNLFFLQTISVPTLGSNGPLWSLANEFWYYIAFPMLLLAARDKGLAKRAAYAGGALLLLVLVGRGIAGYFLVWLLGVVVSFLPKTDIVRRHRPVLTGLLSFAVVAFSMATRWRHLEDLLPDLALALLCMALVYVMVHAESAAPAGLYASAARWSANMSYSLYLVHLPMLVFLQAMMSPDARWIPSLRSLALALVALCAVFVYAVGIYAAFESNTNGVRRRVRRILDGFSPALSPEGQG